MDHQDLARILTHFGLDGLLDPTATAIPPVSTAYVYLQQVVGTQTLGTLDDATVTAARAAIARDMLPREPRWVVRGYIRDAAGNPAANAEVTALDRDLRSETPLGSAATDAAGRYEIIYDAERFARAERGYADLIVRCRRGREARESEILFNAPRVAIINIVPDPLPALPEFLLVTRALSGPLDNIAPADVTDDEITFLCRETGWPRDLVATYIGAHRLARKLAADETLVYACLRLGVPSDFGEFVAQPHGVLAERIDAAWSRRITAPVAADVRDRFFALVERARARLLAEAGEGRPAASALAALLPDDAIRQGVAAFFAGREGAEEPSDMWRAAAADPRVADHVDALRSLVEMAGLFGSHPPLLHVLHDPVSLARWSRQRPWTVTELAGEPRARVRELIDLVGLPAWLPNVDGVEPAELYRRAVDRVLEEVAPTRRVAARLREGSLGVQPAAAARVAAQFLDAHPSFDIRGEPVQSFLERAGVALDEPATRALVGVQRMLHLTPRLDEIEALSEGGFSTVARVAKVPRARLRELVKLDDRRLQKLQHNARRRVLLGAIVAQAAADHGGVDAVPGTQVPPEYASLFGSQDYCECAECRAADGPAAYLVDLLELLRDHGGKALPQLYERRPEIETLTLSCYNTTTPVPHIDLVNEILEGATPPTDESYTASQARIAPQQIKREAYTPLAKATYPWGLPFEVGTARARAVLDAVGWSRAALVDIFADTDQQRAFEYFRVPEAEAALFAAPILESIYGSSDLAALQKVDTFLHRTGLSSGELFALLELPDPPDAPPSIATELSLVPQGECDLGKMSFAGASEAVLITVGLFLRMCKRLRWTIEELHVALRHMTREALPTLDAVLKTPRTWVELWRFARWRRDLRLDRDEALAWLSGKPSAQRDAALRRVLRVDASELAGWLALLDPKPAPGVTPAPEDGAAMDGFVDAVSRLTAGGFSAPDVAWLLAKDRAPARGAMTEAQVGAALHGLRTELQSARRRVEGASGVEDLRRLLAQLPTATSVDEIVASIVGDDALKAAVVGSELAGELTAFPRGTARIERAVAWAREQVLDRDQRIAVVEFLARALGFDRTTLTDPASMLLDATIDGESALRCLLSAEEMAGDPALGVTQPAFVAFRKLERLALLMKRLGLSAAELSSVVTANAGTSGWIAFADLGGEVAADRVQGLLALAEISRLRRALPKSFEVVAHRTATWGSVATALAGTQGWDSDFVTAVKQAIAPDAAPFAVVHVERLVAALAFWVAFFPAKGDAPAAAKLMIACANPAVSFDDAASLEAAVTASMAPNRWAEVGREAHDRLRLERRDALVAHKLQHTATPPDDLLATMLIDTQVSPCLSTSRVKAAIGAVQLFIHRCIMGLEPEVPLSADVAKWWRWMQNFRVWQANRKVFLYPENWIEPELRDDKTPPFVELEGALAQQELTKVNVQSAFRGYLGAVHEVGRLEIVAVFTERRSDCAKVLHVVGRRWSQPRTHFYRQRIGESQWTPWEKLDADIEGEHVMVTVSNGRPTVIWPVIREERDPSGGKDAAGEPLKRWAIRFFWVEREHGRWGAKRSMDPEEVATASKIGSDKFAYIAKASPGSLSVSVELSRVEAQSGVEMLATGDIALPTCSAPGGVSALKPDSSKRPLAMRQRLAGNLGLDTSCVRPLTGEGILILGSGGTMDWVFNPSTPRLGQYQLTPDLVDDAFTTRAFVFQNERDTFVIEPTPTPPRLRVLGEGKYFVGSAASANDAVKHVLSIALDGAKDDGSTALDLSAPVDNPDAPRFYRVSTLEHPQVCELAQRAETSSLEALLSLETQRSQGLTKKPQTFVEFYKPDRVTKPYPVEAIDFSRSGAYATYNWELFFHAPLLIAVRLMQSDRYEEALGYLQLVFDPTVGVAADASGPSRYWQFVPFREVGTPTSVVDILAVLGSDAPNKRALASVLAQLDAYRNEPFNPHLIARLRPGAYMRMVVMRYLDCLIGWGDQLFRRRTLEANNHATLLYVTAAQILGPRPRAVPRGSAQSVTPKDVLAAQDSLEKRLEDVLGEMETNPGCASETPTWPVFDTVRFCVPPNEKLLAYWDTVADRLFKIRHCQDIDGNAISLPLFEPPIDPAILVRATAAGVDIGRVLDGSSVPLPSYRYPIVSQKALELCNDVKALGSELLAVLEKRDAEELSRLRSTQEVALLDAVRSVRQGQLQEAERQLAALERQRDTVEMRRAHYQEVLQRMNAKEGSAERKTKDGNQLARTRGMLEAIAAVFNALPSFSFGTQVLVSWGLPNVGASLEATARGVGVSAQERLAEAAAIFVQGSYDRRSEEWDFQGRIAAAELKQLDQQIAAAQIRVAMAERDLANHDRQRDNARAVDAQMRSKFTNRELFDWMAREASTAYGAAFQLALDMARRAEKCFQFERGAKGRSYIGVAHWDDLRRGLLAGTRLHQELRLMEMAYLDENRRDYEITKHISLSLLDGNQLFALRMTGECMIELDEKHFDVDHPGHYLRRIKSVSLTIPAVVGAHASINAKLTLERSAIRETGSETGDLRILPNGIESIVTSGGQNDSGMFETNLRDERYLPFEGAGAISRWRLELKPEQNQFDPASLTDVILHMRYTAREGTEELRKARAALVRDEPPTMTRLFSLEHDFSAAWAATREAREAGEAFELDLDFTPFLPRRETAVALHVTQFTLLVLGQEATSTTPVFALVAAGHSRVEGTNEEWQEAASEMPITNRRVVFPGHSAGARFLLTVGGSDSQAKQSIANGAIIVAELGVLPAD